jgi:hypothetical protein
MSKSIGTWSKQQSLIRPAQTEQVLYDAQMSSIDSITLTPRTSRRTYMSFYAISPSRFFLRKLIRQNSAPKSSPSKGTPKQACWVSPERGCFRSCKQKVKIHPRDRRVSLNAAVAFSRFRHRNRKRLYVPMISKEYGPTN